MKKTKSKAAVKQEMEKLYDSGFEWIQAGKILRERVAKSLRENPKINLILRLVILANLGVWLTLVLQLFEVI